MAHAGCQESADCPGEVVAGYDRCLGHLAQADRDVVLAEVRAGTRKLRAKGAPLSSEQVAAILEAALEHKGRRVLRDAVFDQATFAAGVRFSSVEFRGEASFVRATFLGSADFMNSVFEGRASFDEATFKGSLWLGGARFRSDASFAECHFEQELAINAFTVLGELDLHRCTFAELARIEVAADALNARGSRFAKSAVLTVHWAEIDLEQASFGAPSVVRSARPAPDPDLVRLCTGAGASHPARERQRRAARTARARVVSLRGAGVGELTLSGLDLRACLFSGASNLEKLRLEDGNVFATTPRGDRQALAEEHALREQIRQRSRLVRARARIGARYWHGPETRSPPLLEPTPKPLPAGEIAAIYRALRKGREDNKDEPGAADFYYGEMEMRRRTKSHAPIRTAGRFSLWAERAILWIYWLTSGYGLRASRALLAMLILLVVFTPLFDLYGFRDRVRPFATAAQIDAIYAGKQVKGTPEAPFPPTPHDLVTGEESLEAWNYAAGTATTLIGSPDAQLTQHGRALRIVLRVLGPLFIGLALLSIRGRVKR